METGPHPRGRQSGPREDPAEVGPISDLCPHFGTCGRPLGTPAIACGGCATQDKPYPDQLAAKQALIDTLVSPFGPAEIRPIIPSPDVFYYRNKMEFAFGGLKDMPPLLGLRQKGKFDRIVDLAECRLLSPDAGKILRAVRRWAEDEGLPTYHLKSHKGFLRYLVVREGKNTRQRMIHLITAEGNSPKASFMAALNKAQIKADTVIWSVNATLSDVAQGEEREVFTGPGFIEDRLGDKTFRISPATFFQTNTKGAEKLYTAIGDLLAADGAETLFDVYCGSGSIGLFLAGRFKKVIGLELNIAAVADAQENAAAQNAPAEFHALDAAKLPARPDLLALWKAPGTAAVFDPPRVGLAPTLRQMLLDHHVDRWVYVSCNPEALARDLPALCQVYKPQVVQPVDLFPHTPHLETVVSFSRR